MIKSNRSSLRLLHSNPTVLFLHLLLFFFHHLLLFHFSNFFLPHQYWCRIILQNCAYKVHLMDSLNSIAFLFRNRETSDHPRADCGHRL